MNYKLVIGIFLALFAIPFAVYVVSESTTKKTEPLLNPVPHLDSSKVLGVQQQEREKKNTASLQKVVEETLSGTKGTYGIVIKHLKTAESYSVGEHEIFEPGSLYKIWVMAAAFQQIQEEELKEDEILSQDIEVLNKKFRISSDAAELKEGTMTFTVSQALAQMITISHNYAALLLSERLRNSHIREFLSSHGFLESYISNSDDPPKTTPYDIALFLEKLYKGELVDKESSEKMIELLKQQTLNDGIPKYLPANVSVAHKTGEIEWFKHDAGIVFSPPAGGGDYIIVILSESSSPLGAQERIAQVSEAVYKYFNP